MKIQVRDDKVVIDGYVNAVERFSKILTNKQGKKFIERIMPSVFQRAIEKNDAIKVLLNHNYDMELANTKDGTAQLFEDNIGLRAIVEITDANVIEKAKQKKLRGWSFGFICNKQDEEVNEKGISERTVRDIDLFEVSIIDDKKIPAYIGTSIEMRDGEVKEIEFRNSEDLTEEETPSTTEDDKSDVENFESMTASQKRELLNGSYRQTFNNGWLEDYDDYFVYGTIKEDSTLYKMPYTITDGVVNIDTTKQIKVVRGGYKEVRYDQRPEQQPTKEVEKIDYSTYEERIRKIKEEIK